MKAAEQYMVQFGKYQIEKQLGSGGYADAYLAFDSSLKRKVVLKVLKSGMLSSPEAYERFLQEAEIMASLDHPRIVWVIDKGEEKGQYYIVLRYIDGESLDQWIAREGALAWRDAYRVVRDIGDALQFAHFRNVLHRDVKPQNILVTSQKESFLSDFGLARASRVDNSITQSGSILGTWEYLAPEIWAGKVYSPASDQFALACVVVQMLSGEGPFQAPTLPAVMKRIIEPFHFPPTWPEDLPIGMRAVIERALAKEPEKRYGQVIDFVLALREAASPTRDTGSRLVVPASPLAQTAPLYWKAAAEEPIGNLELSQSLEKVTVRGERAVLPLANGVDMEFCRVPAGEFRMGSDRQSDRHAQNDEVPQRIVLLDEYWIGRFPVTNRQYAVFLKDRGLPRPTGWPTDGLPSGLEDHPVVYINWEDANAFCAWLSQKTEQTIRIPSEAQWEKASRGVDGRIYPWEDQTVYPHERCNCAGRVGGGKSTTRVGAYSPLGDSPSGCADMAGNVWEWVADWYAKDYYPHAPSSNPTGPSFGQTRVIRGGSWNSDESVARCANRNMGYPGGRNAQLGFRCAAVRLSAV